MYRQGVRPATRASHRLHDEVEPLASPAPVALALPPQILSRGVGKGRYKNMIERASAAGTSTGALIACNFLTIVPFRALHRFSLAT